jgi:hypothetical protein
VPAGCLSGLCRFLVSAGCAGVHWEGEIGTCERAEAY